MSAIIIQQHQDARLRPTIAPEDFMPLATRMHVAREINRLWAEFTLVMHDGSLVGPDVARKFWKYVQTGG